MKAVLNRFSHEKNQTLGQLTVFCDDGGIIFQCATLELAWHFNKRKISCIPFGEYQCHLHISPKFGRTYWLKDVPERSEILIHKGNYNTHTLGCILLGKKHLDINGDGLRDVTSSGQTMKEFLEVMPQVFTLNII
ncbi:MAG: hypothetical protein HRU12_11705 [Phaeodactylibacter sp.]|nr:hypothetical protein [Phaeodactylibacter sp.]